MTVSPTYRPRRPALGVPTRSPAVASLELRPASAGAKLVPPDLAGQDRSHEGLPVGFQNAPLVGEPDALRVRAKGGFDDLPLARAQPGGDHLVAGLGSVGHELADGTVGDGLRDMEDAATRVDDGAVGVGRVDARNLPEQDEAGEFRVDEAAASACRDGEVAGTSHVAVEVHYWLRAILRPHVGQEDVQAMVTARLLSVQQ